MHISGEDKSMRPAEALRPSNILSTNVTCLDYVKMFEFFFQRPEGYARCVGEGCRKSVPM